MDSRMGWARERALETEVLDEADAGLERVGTSLRFMEWANRWLGGAAPVLGFVRDRVQNGEISILDLGTGGGDIPFRLARWADTEGKQLRITAIDVNQACVDYARRRHAHPRIRFLRHSAWDFEALGRFDYILASMFFHHLADEQITMLLRKMFEQARRGFLVNDLYRHPLAYWGVAALSALTLDSVVFHDAKLSVKRGFRREDADNYREWSGVDGMRIEQHPGFRIVFCFDHSNP